MRPVQIGKQTEWEITTTNVKTKEQETHKYNAVMICNGHYTVPFVPNLKGKEKFKGKQWHSHDYREPSTFAGKRVLVVGAGPSGTDIGAQIVTVADKVSENSQTDKVSFLLKCLYIGIFKPQQPVENTACWRNNRKTISD